MKADNFDQSVELDADLTLDTLRLAGKAVYTGDDKRREWRFAVAVADAVGRGWIQDIHLVSNGEELGVRVHMTSSGKRATDAFDRRQAIERG